MPPLSPDLQIRALWVAGAIVFATLCALLSGGTQLRRSVAFGLATGGLIVPLWAPCVPSLRALVSLYLLWSWVKVGELSRDPTERSPGFRMTQVLVLYDLRLDRAGARGRGSLPMQSVAGGAAASLSAVLLLWLALCPPLVNSAASAWLFRHGAGLAFAYLAVEGAVRVLRAVYWAFGLNPPLLHDHPILSRSISEFWGRRWNRMVGGWLFSSYYRPLAAQGRAGLGLVVTFIASAALHFYFCWIAVGARPALLMATFFLAQIPLVALERYWRIASWRPALRRLWTVAWLTTLSPLFVGPLLTIVDPMAS